jgi:hypothetical protein
VLEQARARRRAAKGLAPAAAPKLITLNPIGA